MKESMESPAPVRPKKSNIKEKFMGGMSKVALISALGPGCVLETAMSELHQCPLTVEVDLNIESKQYQEILDEENFQGILKILNKMHFVDKSDDEVSGRQIVLHMLTHFFDQEQDRPALEKMLESWMESIIPEYRITLLRVAHSLWVEKNHKVPWSLKEYTRNQVDMMFFNPYHQGGHSAVYPKIPSAQTEGGVIDLNRYPAERYPETQMEVDAATKLYPLAEKLRSDTSEDSIVNTVRWLKTSFFHIHVDQDGTFWDFDLYRDGRTDDKKAWGFFLPTSLSRFFEERAEGCHEPVILLAGMLRSLNIPAMNIQVEGHGVTYAPTINRFVHGDIMANFPALPMEFALSPHKDFQNIDDGTDTMLTRVMEKKVDDKYPEKISFLLYALSVDRQEESLEVPSYKEQLPQKYLDIFRTEMPQYGFKFEADGKTVTSHPVPIRTLEDLSRPDADVWE